MTNKTVLITGCASGFGKLLVPALLEAGWQVIATHRQGSDRQDLFADQLAKHGARLTVANLDVTVEGDRNEMAALVERNFGGKLDALINNAGFGLFGALEDLGEAQIRHQMEVNFFGLTLLTRTMLPALRRARGRLINFSSAMGFSGMPLSALYCASKFAVEGLSESLYYELKPHGVAVALVEPGAFRTSFGDKLQLGAGSRDDASPYAMQSRAYDKFRERLRSGTGNSPEAVVRAVVRLLGSRRMPLRVRVGGDVRGLHLLKRLTPESWSRGLLTRLFTKLFTLRPVADAH